MPLHSTRRLAAILPVFLLASHLTLVVFNNLFDYSSNFRFVQAILSMEDVFSAGQTWRSMPYPWIHHFAYLLIIITELFISVMLWAGTLAMWRRRNAVYVDFTHAGGWAIRGLILGMVLWFGFFLVIGGEWFLMWQSEKWNGQTTAFYLTLTYLAVLILQLLPEKEEK